MVRLKSLLRKLRYHFIFRIRWSDISNHLTTSIWCGWCGSEHLFRAWSEVVCPTTGQSLQSTKAWRINGVYVGPEETREKQDIFIAWDNLAKWQGKFKEKCVTEQKVWNMMFTNAYSKHKNPEGKYKGCKECQKTDAHKEDFEKIYLKASWRDSLDEGYGIDTLEELKRARHVEEITEKVATLLRCSPSEIGVKINKLLKEVKDLEAEVKKYEKPEDPKPPESV